MAVLRARDPRLVNGLVALTKHVGAPAGKMDNLPLPNLYFLWSVERVAVVYDLRTIGGQDWYAWGVSVLLAHQAGDGSWKDAFPGPIDTCFALLFLKRGSVPIVPPIPKRIASGVK